MIQIPHEITDGYQVVPTDSQSSIVLRRDETVLKLTQRTPVARAIADYERFLSRFGETSSRIPHSVFGQTTYRGKMYTATGQRRLAAGRTLAEFASRPGQSLDWVFGNPKTGPGNVEFVLELIDWLLSSSQFGELYPDPVGWAEDPKLSQSRNLLVLEGGFLVLCDVGLSPHADTLGRVGGSFYDGENVKRYRREMTAAREYLLRPPAVA